MAAALIHRDLKHHLEQEGFVLPWDHEILIYLWCDAEKMAEQYVSEGVLCKREDFHKFLRGFNNSHDSAVMWNIRTEDECIIQRKQGMAQTSQTCTWAPPEQLPAHVISSFSDALCDPDCVRIVLGSETFSPFKKLLEAEGAHDDDSLDLLDKIDPFFQSPLFRRHQTRISPGSYFVPAEQARTSVNLPQFTVSPCSRDTRLQGTPNEVGVVKRNKDGKRLDPHTDFQEDSLNMVKFRSPKLCNNFHLLNTCIYGDRCGYKHGCLSIDDKKVLQEIAREQPCRYGAGCADPACYAGHRCLRKGRCGDRCRFPKDMHFKDIDAVNSSNEYLGTSTLKSKTEEMSQKQEKSTTQQSGKPISIHV